jgi:hypothetical protein
MEVDVVADRSLYIADVLTVSPYDDQHTEAAKFCFHLKVGSQRGLNSVRLVDPDKWPTVTMASLKRIMRIYAKDFENNADFHLSERKKIDHRAVLTPAEREDLAASMREAALSGNPYNNAEKRAAVIDILSWRKAKQAGGGRSYVKLSAAANRILKVRKVGRDFWRAFMRDFPMLQVKKVKETSSQRAKQCSLKVATEHCQAMKATLIKLGLWDEALDRMKPDKWGNIIWLDECGNFFNYNLRRGTSRMIMGVRNMLARTALNENRGTFTVDAALGGDGYMYDPHLIFAQDSLSTDMIPPGVAEFKHMLLTNNDCGVQTGLSFLQR